ncbi:MULTISPECIES: hypothetical protein [Levilactobacillus]|uniref:hypothetical protein n=1 Tax=Levilactobacillus TaxID=2767886 RepID=UPI00194E7ED0|nr:hypothetical protein [Levilactobacillus sp. 244-2]
MKLSKSFKYSLLSFMALTTLGVTLNTSPTTAHAATWQAAGDTTWSPHWNDGVKSSYSVSGQGASLGSASWGKDGMHAWVPKNGMTIKYEKLGVYPGTKKQIDMWVKVKSHSGSSGMGYKSEHGVSFNMFSGGSETANVEISFHYHSGGVVKWDNDVIGLAYTDLEPAKLGNTDSKPILATSFDQSIKSNTHPSSWHPWTDTHPRYSWIDTKKAENDLFQVQNGLTFPSNLQPSTSKIGGKGWDPLAKRPNGGYGMVVPEKKGTDYPNHLHTIWADVGSRDLNPDIHYSGAIVEYKADGAKTIDLTIKGHGSGNNEYVFTGAKSFPKPKSTISKSITYNGKTSTANTLKDKNDTMVYNVNATVSAKKGAYITDTLPKRFTVTKISAVTNFSHNSVADVNSTHKFKGFADLPVGAT